LKKPLPKHLEHIWRNRMNNVKNNDIIADKKIDRFIVTKRFRKSDCMRNEIDEFYSDRSRIIYSSSFRRLQQKAQVFSLESNSSIRTRMTHSLEVADIGRTLANKIAFKLSEQELITKEAVPQMVAIVENACLLHDIGNPPFGHFGESAIKKWSVDIHEIAKKAGIDKHNSTFINLIKDFSEFDGNPQGFRTITKLHTENNDKYGLNLTYSTLMCALKYSRVAGDRKGEGVLKKAGYFQTEEPEVKQMYGLLKLARHTRYPLTYIMEAADDISYCLSDIADGIEKRIITRNDFIKCFKDTWNEKYPKDEYPVNIPDNPDYNFNLDVAVKWSKSVVDEATQNFIKNFDKFCAGKEKQLISENGMGRVLETIKCVSRKELYTSIQAESIELTGFAVITGILNSYKCLLELPYKPKNNNRKCYKALVDGDNMQTLEYERRLYNRLGERYKKAYLYAVKDLNEGNADFVVKEWWLRTHLVIDHISGMTDEFALNTYQMLGGIQLLKI